MHPRVVRVLAEDEVQAELRDDHDERERREAAGDVHEVGARQLQPTAEPVAHASLLDEHGRDGKPEQREPDELRAG